MKYLFAMLLSGCASFEGVKMDDKERTACTKEGCSAWTDRELNDAAKYFFNLGYQAGKKSI